MKFVLTLVGFLLAFSAAWGGEMIFKVYDSDFGVKYKGVRYDFPDTDNLQIEDPEFTRLTRGASGLNSLGIVYKEGIKEPKRWTVTIMNMTVSIKNMLDTAYANKDRLDVFCVNRSDGSSKMAKDAVLCQKPQQLTVDDSAESMNVALIFETFNSAENHKT